MISRRRGVESRVSGDLRDVVGRVELDTLVLEVMNQMRVLAQDRLKMRLGDMDQVLVCGDRDRLKQVLVNLVGNAINYTPAGGRGAGFPG